MIDTKSLRNEDSFDDNDYAEYETMDYFDAAGEDNERKTLKDVQKKTRKREEREQLDFYKCKVKVERGEESRKRYTRLAEIVRTGSEAEKQKAREDACLYMKGFVRDFIRRSFCTYVERDPGYAKDLEQEAYFNIMKYLPFYDSEKGLPSTFFFRHIQSAMVSTTNQMKHSISPSDAVLQRKIRRINKEFEKIGRTPSIADYMVETGETMSMIRSVLRMMNTDMNTHLEAIEEYDQLIAGDPAVNSAYESPESQVLRTITYENVIRRMRELFPHDEIQVFLRYAIQEDPISVIAKDLGLSGDDKVRRIIEKIRHGIAYDAEIRSLCSGYIKKNPSDMAVINILPVAGENENMDLLETIAL